MVVYIECGQGNNPPPNKDNNMNLSKLSDLTLSMLAAREDLTPAMVVVIVAELRSRREAREAAARAQAIADWYDNSISGSVLEDYREGNTITITVG